MKKKKTFKEKTQFYKERQLIYDLAKNVNDNKLDSVELFGMTYTVIHTLYKEEADHILMYSKKAKRPIVLQYYDDWRWGYGAIDKVHIHSKKMESSVLLYLKLIDKCNS